MTRRHPGVVVLCACLSCALACAEGTTQAPGNLDQDPDAIPVGCEEILAQSPELPKSNDPYATLPPTNTFQLLRWSLHAQQLQRNDPELQVLLSREALEHQRDCLLLQLQALGVTPDPASTDSTIVVQATFADISSVLYTRAIASVDVAWPREDPPCETRSAEECTGDLSCYILTYMQYDAQRACFDARFAGCSRNHPIDLGPPDYRMTRCPSP